MKRKILFFVLGINVILWVSNVAGEKNGDVSFSDACLAKMTSQCGNQIFKWGIERINEFHKAVKEKNWRKISLMIVGNKKCKLGSDLWDCGQDEGLSVHLSPGVIGEDDIKTLLAECDLCREYLVKSPPVKKIKLQRVEKTKRGYQQTCFTLTTQMPPFVDYCLILDGKNKGQFSSVHLHLSDD